MEHPDTKAYFAWKQDKPFSQERTPEVKLGWDAACELKNRELSDMQARTENAERQLSTRDEDYLRGAKMVADNATEWKARAEAAEAALIEKDKALNACAFPNYCGGERQDLLEVMESRQNFARLALLLTPAETRSVIAGLREEVAKLTESRDYWERESEREREQRQKEIGMQEYRGNTISYIYDKERNYGAHFDRMRGEIAALISAGNGLHAIVEKKVSGCMEMAIWQAAVSGAHAGAKGESECDVCGVGFILPSGKCDHCNNVAKAVNVNATEDMNRLDWLTAHASHFEFEYRRAGWDRDCKNFAHGVSIRAVIDAARKAQP